MNLDIILLFIRRKREENKKKAILEKYKKLYNKINLIYILNLHMKKLYQKLYILYFSFGLYKT